MQISNSKLRVYRRCPNRYRYKYPMKLRPKAKALPLEKGTWMHKLLQAHYGGESVAAVHKELTREFNNLWDEVREELGDLPRECAELFRRYRRHYLHDEKRYRVIDTEMDEIVTLPNGLRLEVVVDKIMEDLVDGGLWVVDYKFREKLSDPDSMMLDPQLTLYYRALEYMGYKPLRGAMYDEVRTTLPKVPEVLKSGQLSRRMNIDTDVYTYMRAIKDLHLNPQNYVQILQHIATREDGRFFRRTSMPKDPPVLNTTMHEAVDTAREIQTAERFGRYPRTFDKSCVWQCEYKELCIAELYGADIASIIRANYEVSKRD